MDSFYGTNVCAGTTIGANFRVNFINVAFRDSFYRTFIDASSARDAIFADNMSHDKMELNEYYLA
jgi:hypothetical protein